MALASSLVTTAASAEEDRDLPIEAEVPATVIVGEGRPYIELRALAPVQNIKVSISRAGAAAKRFGVAKLGEGGVKVFQWSERPGIYTYDITVEGKRGKRVTSTTFDTRLAYLEPIKMQMSRDQVDLAKRTAVFQMNHPAARATAVVKAPDGSVLARGEETYGDAAPGTPLEISWPEVDGEVGRIDIEAHSSAGYWVGMALLPWSVSIPHEEVEFETDRSEIRPSEEPKLDRAIELIHKALREHGNEMVVQLYVGGFTDTQGSTTHNRTLSDDRAKAIAQYFARNKVSLDIHYRGYGEEVLEVQTPDETDNPRNRRAVYILAAQPPAISKTVTWGAWKRLR
jgi:outer membrane protein OmpA-like peptidoglycan-associated protein